MPASQSVSSILPLLAVTSQSLQSSACLLTYASHFNHSFSGSAKRISSIFNLPCLQGYVSSVCSFPTTWSQWIQSSVNETYSPQFACNIQSIQAAVFVQHIKQVSSIHSLSATFSHFNLQFSCNLEKLFSVHISIYIIIITIIKVDNFCIARFSGVPKLTVLYNILQHFLSSTNIIHIIMTTNNV